MERLERRYRRLMRAYPAGYRRERGDEIVDTYLAGAAPGQRRPSVADAVDVAAAGLRVRLAGLGTGIAGQGLRTAAPVALAVVAGVAVVGLLRDGRATAEHPAPYRAALLVHAAWLACVAARILLPALAARLVAVLALLGTLAALAGLSTSWASPSPGWSLAVMALLGSVAVLGGGARLSTRERALLAAGTGSAALLGGTALVVPATDLPSWLDTGWATNSYQSGAEALVALAVAALLAVMAVLARHRGRRWRTATLVLLGGAGWLMLPSPGGGGARLVLGAILVLAVAAAVLATRRPAAGPRSPSPATLAVGFAAGLAGVALPTRPQPVFACPGGQVGACQELMTWVPEGRPAYAAWLLAVVGWAVLPRPAARALVAVAVVATPAVLWPGQVDHPAPDKVGPMTLSVLGIVALLTSTGPARRAERWGAPVAALAVPVLLALAVLPYGMLPSPSTLFPAFVLAQVPLVVAGAVAWRRATAASGRERAAAAATVALSAAWIGVLAFDVTGYRPAGVLLAAAAAGAAVVFRGPRRPAGQPVPVA